MEDRQQVHAAHDIYSGFRRDGVDLLLQDSPLLQRGDMAGFVVLHKADGSTCSVRFDDTPERYEPANLIGLRFLLRFGMPEKVTETTLRFHQEFRYF